jgi:hypothetical protein
MPHILVVFAGALSLYCAFRWVRRETERVDNSLRRAENRILRENKAKATPLAFDSATGVYRPVD